MLDKITWLGHASFKIKNKKTIYFDPFQLKGKPEPADIIFISHEHYDHCSEEDIKKIQKESTILIGPKDALEKLSGKNKKEVKPYDRLEIEGYRIETIPAYNIDKEFHPKEKNWVGFIVEIDGKRIYHAGDTDFIPEMKDLKNIYIALLPVSGTYVMNVEEAIKAAESFKPEIVIPMHYGSIIGSEEDAIKFKNLYSGRTEILKI